MARFMLVLRNEQFISSELPPERFEPMMQAYFAWAEKLKQAGALVATERLAEGGRTLRKRDDHVVVDGPYCETKELVGGYFVLEAASLDAAVELGRGCPILDLGGSVEVREFQAM